MIPVSYLFDDDESSKHENVDEGLLGDIGHTIKQRTFLRDKPVTKLPSKNPALRRAAAVINNRQRM